jgi:regulator of RNase E activity RraA
MVKSMVLGTDIDTGQEGQATAVPQIRSAAVGDILDRLGRTHQFLPPGVRPIAPAMSLVGRAMPVLIGDVFGEQRHPFGRMTEALDQLRPGEIYVARAGRNDCASWGEIMTAAARARGSVGAVIDGYHRDTSQVLAQDWPVFSRGAYGQDARVRASVLDFRVPIMLGKVLIRPGEMIVADCDGVVVIPMDVEEEVVQEARQKSLVEAEVLRAVKNGMSTTEAFAAYGVL